VAVRQNSGLPASLTDVLICEAMGWSWEELMHTPAHVVDDVRVLLQKRAVVSRERANAEEARARAK